MNILCLFKGKKGTEPVQDRLDSLSSELRGIKKALRKQGILLEKIEQTLDNGQGATRQDHDLKAALMDLATAFFLLEQGLSSGSTTFTSDVKEALDMVRDKLDRLLNVYRISMIKETGSPFDPSCHECIRREGGDETVKTIVSPGFIVDGIVVRAAKVIV